MYVLVPLATHVDSCLIELGSLYEAGVIHRDVSPSNLIISDSEKPGGHIIDFDHSKIAYSKSPVTQPKKSEDVEVIASSVLQSQAGAMRYVVNLKLLWEIYDRTPTPGDFHWPKVGKND
jgi:tRNA A-37 threonylcarbamoyl transferase component Bud32